MKLLDFLKLKYFKNKINFENDIFREEIEKRNELLSNIDKGKLKQLFDEIIRDYILEININGDINGESFINGESYFSNFILEIFVKNPEIIDFLLQEDDFFLIEKINENNYKLEDFCYSRNRTYFLKYLPFEGEENEIVTPINKKLILNNQKYYVINCNNIDQLTDLRQKKYKFIESYFKNLKIKKYYNGDISINLDISLFHKISIINPINKSISFKDNPLLLDNEVKLDDNTIIVIHFEDYLKMAENPDFRRRISHCKIICDDNERNKIKDRLSKMWKTEDRIQIDLREQINELIIKVNHLLYIINNSNLSSDKKELYSYNIKKICNKTNLKFDYQIDDVEKKLKHLVEKLLEEISFEEISKITDLFNNENDDIRHRNIDKEEFSGNIFILQNPQFETWSKKEFIQKIFELPDDKLNIILNNERIASKLEYKYDENLDLELIKQMLQEEFLILNLQELNKKDLISFILSSSKAELLLNDERIKRKLGNIYNSNMSFVEKRKLIEWELLMLKYPLNDDILDFVERNNIDAITLFKSEKFYIYSKTQCNDITSYYQIKKSREHCKISIADIIGCNNEWVNDEQRNILIFMKSYFDSNGDGYHQRSLGLLEYNNDEIIKKLESSFQYEPIILSDFDDDKYFVTNNGRHRYTILRLHYLLECMNGGDLEQLKDKYTIPVIIEKTDFFKTYCNYLLCNLDMSVKFIYNEIDKDGNFTGNVVILKNNDSREVIGVDELKNLVALHLESIGSNKLEIIREDYSKYDSFKRFIDENFENFKHILNNEMSDVRVKN